jgi:hypothetical protein
MYLRCGPFKLAYILNQCLDRFELPEENIRHETSDSESVPRSPSIGLQRSSLPPVLAGSQATESTVTQMMNDTTISDAELPPTALDSAGTMSTTAQVLIVDDNSINRSVSIKGPFSQEDC